MALAALVAVVALVALLGPAVLAEPAIVVQPAELAVLAELAEAEPLSDEDLHDEPGLEAFGLVYHPYYTNGEVVRFGRVKKSFTLVVRWKETEHETSVFHLIYAILVT